MRQKYSIQCIMVTLHISHVILCQFYSFKEQLKINQYHLVNTPSFPSLPSASFMSSFISVGSISPKNFPICKNNKVKNSQELKNEHLMFASFYFENYLVL